VNKFRWKPNSYPLVITGLIAICAGIIAIASALSPALFQEITSRTAIFFSSTKATIDEMSPFLFPGGTFTLAVAWLNFTLSFFISFISIAILIFNTARRKQTDFILLLAWSIVTLIFTLLARRFAYYYTINVALLSGYFCWMIIEFFSIKRTTVIASPKSKKQISEKVKPVAASTKSPSYSINYLALSISSLAVFFGVLFPNIGNAVNTAKTEFTGPSNAWCESLTWMKDNTPDPFGNPDFYYSLYSASVPRQFKYPASAYGVTSSWDAGYWITRIAHRMPTENPATADMGEANFFVAQDENSANSLLDRLSSQYVVEDKNMVDTQNKFSAFVLNSGNKMETYGDVFYTKQADSLLKPTVLLYPEYYRTMTVRLYSFNGLAVVPAKCQVVNYEEKKDSSGSPYKLIISLKSFSSYEQAAGFVSSQKSGFFKLVSDDPFSSPVPLTKLDHYELVHGSEIVATTPSAGKISEVKIFKYTK
jgi:asparagine N-glycosylation enzyme membrane subunit Stt3